MRILALVFLLTITGFSTQAFTAANWQQFHQWPTVGETRFRVFFFKVYDIELRTPSGQYRDASSVESNIGIKINYLRDISKQELINNTSEQWQHLGIPEFLQKQWLPQLDTVWSDIRKGDAILFTSDGKSGRFFYKSSNAELTETGSINGTHFNNAFLSIWLSPNTQYRGSRKKLLGIQ
jgi:hypothetical protein